MNRQLTDYCHTLLKDVKQKQPLNFDDTQRGVLIALIKDRPTIWNSTAKLTKDDVLASFTQIQGIVEGLNKEFGIWQIIEKWCWLVESYVRCSLVTPSQEWRYNNTLDFLKPYAGVHFPYLGCLSKKRRSDLTELYADDVITKVMEATEETDFPPGIFFEELHYISDEATSNHVDIAETNSFTRTVGQMVNMKRRGRPSKADKRSPVDPFIHLTPQSAQFQKLLESNGINGVITAQSFAGISFVEPEDTPDELDFGFTPAMYRAFIECVKDIPQIWASKNPNRENQTMRAQNFEDIARKMITKFNGTVDVVTLEKWTSPFMEKIYDKLKEKFDSEDKSPTMSTWRYFEALKFTSYEQPMPALTLGDVFMKSEEPSTSFSGYASRATVASPTGSSQSEDSRMASSSPSTATQFGMSSNGNKSIKMVLENLVARSMKEEQGLNGSATATAVPIQDFSDLKQLMDAKFIKIENENGPPTKRVKPDGSFSPPVNPKMIVYNDGRTTKQAPISTWVPPKEDLLAKPSKEDSVPQAPQRRPQATAVVKNGTPLDNKQLKRLFQSGVSGMIPVTTASMVQRNGLIGINPMAIQQSALQQALLKKMEPSTTLAASIPTMPSVSSPQILQAQVMMNGSGMTNGTSSNSNSDTEDKWTLLGKLVSTMAREVEIRDPLVACEMYKDLHNVIYKYNLQSLRPKENHHSS